MPDDYQKLIQIQQRHLSSRAGRRTKIPELYASTKWSLQNHLCSRIVSSTQTTSHEMGRSLSLMEVGFFDTVEEIKQKLQSRRGWPAAAIQQQQQQEAKGREGEQEGAARAACDRGVAVRRAGRVEVAVCARAAVSALRAELEVEAGFPLPRDGGYFFIHRQSVMDEARSFEWHGVASGDEVVVFDGSVTRGPAYC
ncbi:hypothetical protein PR202_gb22271 [Eleusine coracana subsp. coracana]|uniref:Ubiquitin-like domain-containing protein n=1 Tax=Eleusine coracana subsp. coracana TaxID=191504 RepID=A0AAV5FFC0_ELECO|nr:hypothetical protein PR202_gb22271 [Eleusine coracana subsp. coracana]